MTTVLGLSAYYHDSAAALVVDGEIVAAAQEERFSRQKHDESFPRHAIDACLKRAGTGLEDVDFVAFYDKPMLKFDRLLETHLMAAPRGIGSFARALPVWLKTKLHIRREIQRELGGALKRRPIFVEHHESHAASAFFPSPFERAAIVTLDGVGEWATASVAIGEDNRIRLEREMHFPHSLGLLYSTFTAYCGFRVNDGEYKLMGLAPYGSPVYADRIRERLLHMHEDGSLQLDLRYFDFCGMQRMHSPAFERLFEGPPRGENEPIQQRHMDLAASMQRVTEEVVLQIVAHVHEQTGEKNLCLAGGVALNCVANGRVLREGPFERLFIQPAAGDAGGALGAALFTWHQLLERPRAVVPGDAQRGSRLGPEYSSSEIESCLEDAGVPYQRVDDEEELCRRVAELLDSGAVVGWFQGAMEFGPRALGSRSILADPRNPEMQSRINQKVKFREGFRPFAPVVLEEHAAEYFQWGEHWESPYMLLVTPVHERQRVEAPEDSSSGFGRLRAVRSRIPAVTHVDSSARVQTVDRERDPRLRQLLEAFRERTGCPVLVNTSFNLGWEPIVASPQDALRTFLSCDLDVLVLGDHLVRKQQQPAVRLSQPGADETDPLLQSCWACPACGSALEERGDEIRCASDPDHSFRRREGITELFWPHEAIDDPGDVTETVKQFYEETPFPNYDDHDSLRSLIDKSRRGRYARLLDESIGANSKVLEVGCGTGQLSNFLGIHCRQVIGTDLCGNSLRLGESFRREHGLERVRFVQMNLFQPAFRPGSFDVVLCNGVLHHTADPFGGFRGLAPLVKPGGFLVVGLYNTYGRLMTDLRRLVFRLTGGRFRSLDPVLRRGGQSVDKRRAWFADQYRHPHESKHTMGEVLGWFEQCGLQFVRGVPALRLQDDGLAGPSLFEPQQAGTAFDRFLVQGAEIFAPGQKEGGFFVMIAQRPHREEG